MIFVVDAMGIFSLAFFCQIVLPESVSISIADLADTDMLCADLTVFSPVADGKTKNVGRMIRAVRKMAAYLIKSVF